MTNDERDLDALLRQAAERLAPPESSWGQITRRARRRKWAKASLAVAAGVVVVAGAVPAVIAVRDNSSDQSLQQLSSNSDKPHPRAVTASPKPAPRLPSMTPTPTPTLNGFTPTSVSFVSQGEAWLWGSTTHFGPGVIAWTDNGGRRWSRLPAPAITSTDPAGSGDYGIRFADGDTGFVFGTKLFLTQDAGQSWEPVTVPGRVIDLETMNNRVWALVRSCASCTTLRLYGATVDNPTHFAVVRGVPPLQSSPNAIDGGSGSIAVNQASVYVMVGASSLWSSPDGVKWVRGTNPCPAKDNFANAVSAWSPTGIAAACGGEPAAGSELKRVFESTDSGATWTRLPDPSTAGSPTSVSAGTARDVILGVAMGSGYVTNNRGKTWGLSQTHSVNLSFVGFVSHTHVVALPSTDVGQRAFLSSDNAGRTWTVYRFPK